MTDVQSALTDERHANCGGAIYFVDDRDRFCAGCGWRAGK